MRRPTTFLLACLLFTLALTVAPLWAGPHLPFVDVPQHLHLIDVLGRLEDPNTLYAEVFTRKSEVTPYLGYYLAVAAVAKVMPLLPANALVLSLVAIATVLTAFWLSKELGGPGWSALLAGPLFYGDNLSWGFLNYCASLPLLLGAMAMFVRVLKGESRFARLDAVGLAVLLLAIQLTHVQSFVFAGMALPLLLMLTPAHREERIRACLAALPAVLLFAVWSLGRLGEKPDVAPGEPWKAWGPLLSKENLSFKPVDENLRQFTKLLQASLSDGSDTWITTALVAAGVLCIVLSFVSPTDRLVPLTFRERLRAPLLVGLALGCFVWMPFDVRGYMYYLNWRFAELTALLAVVALPLPFKPVLRRPVVAGLALIACIYGLQLRGAYRRFEFEANALDTVIAAAGNKPRVMALSFDTQSQVVTHPVYLHAASYLALAKGGMTSFSFARTGHSPLAYLKGPPPAPPSEWRADQFDYAAYGRSYDHYLVRGAVPAQAIFRGRQGEVHVAAQSGAFTLYVRDR